jgi:hypothetical protein
MPEPGLQQLGQAGRRAGHRREVARQPAVGARIGVHDAPVTAEQDHCLATGVHALLHQRERLGLAQGRDEVRLDLAQHEAVTVGKVVPLPVEDQHGEGVRSAEQPAGELVLDVQVTQEALI